MSKTSSTAHNSVLSLGFFLKDWNFLGDPDFSLLPNTKLSHLSLSPSIQSTLFGDSKGVISSSINSLNRFPIESLDILRSRCNLDTLGQTKLALKSSSPRVNIEFICQDQGVGLTTSDLDDSLISKWFQDLWGEHLFGASVASCAKGTRAITEHITIPGQVESVVPSTGDLLKVAHFFSHSVSILVDLLRL